VEMAYYLRAGEEHAACQVFNELFHVTDLPRAVRSMLRIVARGRRNPNSRFMFQDKCTDKKVWPNARVSFLFWRVLVKIMKPGEIGKVYAELNSRFTSTRERLSFIRNPFQMPPGIERKKEKGLTDLSAQRPPDAPSPYSLIHFRLFLRAYARTNHTSGIINLVRRIGRLGWRPRHGYVMSIARAYARGGSSSRLAFLLDRLRRDAELYQMRRAQELVERARQDPNHVGASSRMPTHLGMYRSAIRAMIDHSRYADAARLARHLQRRLKYKLGSDELTDRVLMKLYAQLRSSRNKGLREPSPHTI